VGAAAAYQQKPSYQYADANPHPRGDPVVLEGVTEKKADADYERQRADAIEQLSAYQRFPFRPCARRWLR